MAYTLTADGDDLEKYYWNAFVEKKFPTYQTYWATKICPLTNRPTNIHFKKSAELLKLGYTSEDICKAQLHYTVFRHLISSYEILNRYKDFQSRGQTSVLHTELLAEGLFHICGAQDVAFEFLQRCKTPNVYDSWAPKKKYSPTRSPGSDEATRQWQADNGNPLQDIREYRNHFTHGRIAPCVPSANSVLVPKISKQNDYLDWRMITDSFNHALISTDFEPIEIILQNAWDASIQYFETEWQKI